MDENCNQVYGTDGKVLKMKVRIDNAKFTDGSPQSLYWPEGHEHAGIFKGVAAILVKHGFAHAFKLWAQCKDFKCAADATDCCCRQILYNQPDFVAVPSTLEKLCRQHGYQVLFLPKFHCELNFIKQCWGFSKCLYCQYPATLKEADLEQNVVSTLDSVPLDVMCR